MKFESYSFTVDDMTEQANIVKECIITALENDKMLKESGQTLAAQYVVVVHKPTWFGSIWAKIFSTEDKQNRPQYSILRTCQKAVDIKPENQESVV